MAEGHSENSVSADVQGSVIQVGSMHGDFRVEWTPERLEFLSAAVIHTRLAKASPHQAAMSLAMLGDPAKAAEVIRMIPVARRIEIIASMDASTAKPILSHLPEEAAAPLRTAIMAAHSMADYGSTWHDVLGDAKGDLQQRETSKRGTSGYASHYEHGTAYWTERTGTGMVAGVIKKRFWELDGLSGRLGYPIGRETRAAKSVFGTSGSFQRFESTWDYAPEVIKNDTPHGATIYASEKGVFATWGAIGQYYEASGGTGGPLGFPLSEELSATTDSGENTPCCQHFEGGVVYWSQRTGTARVQGPIREAYLEELDALAIPVGDQEPAAPSQAGTQGVFQRFRYYDAALANVPVLIYFSEAYGPWVVSGPFADHFERSGGTAGPLGFPSSDEEVVHAVDGEFLAHMQNFESGVTVRPRRGDTFGVLEEICELWFPRMPELGMPVAEERTIGNGPDRIQLFERGMVTEIDGVARHWISST